MTLPQPLLYCVFIYGELHIHILTFAIVVSDENVELAGVFLCRTLIT